MEFVKILVLIVCIHNAHGFLDPYPYQNMDMDEISGKYCDGSFLIPTRPVTTDEGKKKFKE